MRRRGVGRTGRPGLIGTAARTAVIAGTATAVSGKVAASQTAAAHTRAAGTPVAAPPASAPPASAPPAPPPAPGPAPVITDEMVDQLKKLGELRDAGILTEDEFAAKKAAVLGD